MHDPRPAASPPPRPERSGGIVPIAELILRHANEQPSRPAILSADGPALTYAAFHELLAATAGALRRMGVRREDRVAVVLPAGPEACAAVVAVAAASVCVPINPQIGDADWLPRLRDMRVRALLTRRGTSGAAERAARDLGVPVIEACPRPETRAGAFELEGEAGAMPAEDRPAGVDDDAFILQTAGTTSRPKPVPLTHANILHSATGTARSLRLTPEDRLLGVLPVHHAHGLISGLMSTLVAGGSILPMPLFSAGGFFDHLRAFRPSWYTAVPAIHQAILAEAERSGVVPWDHSLRLVRSASAPLSARQHDALERLFGVPVIEAYGMTEAASQVASNPLPPGERKLGSVGLPTGQDVAILDDEGRSLPEGRVGQIALRGPNITRGEEAGTADDAAPRKDGWFLTGDLGFRDADGYLFITGRAKDLINRGGEKIAPRRIEEVLLRHPAVLEAVAFPVPSPRLGEDVAAAVVLRTGAAETGRELRNVAVASGRLSLAEIPRRIVVVQEIPKSAAGKVQRHRMAERLGLSSPAAPRPDDAPGGGAPVSGPEERIAEIWKDVLELGVVGRGDDFFALGGDSLLAVQVAIRISEAVGVLLTLRDLFDAPTIPELARLVAAKASSAERESFTLRAPDPGSSIQAPVSIAQERILAVEAGIPGYPVYTVPFAYSLTGRLDPEAFERSVKILISRHEILRTVFKRIGGRWSGIPSGAVNIRVPVEDWKIVPEAHRVAFVDSLLDDEVWTVFDLARAAPFRLRLIRFSETRHVLILVIHHIVMDAWTMRNLLQELFACYAACLRGERVPAGRHPVQYSDYARWQRRWCGGDDAARQMDDWRRALSGARPAFAAGGHSPRDGASFSTERVAVSLPRRLVGGLGELARQEGTTLLVVLLAGLRGLIGAETGHWDSCIAIPMANRSRPNTRGMLGLFENTVVIRAGMSPEMPFRQAVARLREAVLDAHAAQELPFEIVVKRLAEEGALDRAAPSEIYFSLLDHYEPSLKLDGLRVERMELSQDKNSVLPLNDGRMMFLLRQTKDGVLGSLVFKSGEVSASEAQRFSAAYKRVLSSALTNPEQALGELGR